MRDQEASLAAADAASARRRTATADRPPARLRLASGVALFGVSVVSFFVLAGAAPAAADATVFAPKAMPGRTTVIDVWCGTRATSASVDVTPFGGPPELPLAPYPAGGPGAFRVSYRVPADAAPGSYDLVAECDNGQAGDAALLVGLPTAPDQTKPSGGRTTAAVLATLAVLAALVGGVALAKRYGPRSRLHT
ncbi:hypothetical protein DFJ67_7731 [Asanoa ferruginea]|uniref:MYXO-CTERM domain-containing protein n=1 Tax=Asanoa ferruginea TaxID=53367 RepID=A0A3D9ZWT0_9ACTN|nr:hypothetical protein [Asanoa ferruginea]REG01646.1 hypothetical protein DFJ67_7731 [Asanoa ferruginea]GIF52643.1 hypothetical protein Afe04nite_71820 [Asanoa ferruginea]